MKINLDTNVIYKKYLLISCILQVNGSFLSRLKSRYEYLPLTTKDITVEDMDYIQDEFLPERSFPTAISDESYHRSINENYIQTTQLYKHLTQSSAITNIVEYITQTLKFQKRTFNSEAPFYYDSDKWTTIQPFVPTQRTLFKQTPTAITKRKKRTWPPYFPPKFISKLQAELDDALLPWRPTEKVATNETTTELKHYESSSCYMCGLDQKGIPVMPGCYHAFESDDHRHRKLKRSFKVKCIKDSTTRRIKNKHYGPNYIGGCFKRFLDVGIEYNERGCRTKEPMRGMSYASDRLASLEKMLTDIEDGCVFSPFASLTPFNRAVSLFVRYHVCVCKGNYCNRASNLLQLNINRIILLAFVAQ